MRQEIEFLARQVIVAGAPQPDYGPIDEDADPYRAQPVEFDVVQAKAQVSAVYPDFDWEALHEAMVEEQRENERYLAVVAPDLDRTVHLAWIEEFEKSRPWD